MIDIAAIKARFERLAPYLDERARRLFAANEALSAGWGGITAVSEATGVARSTIGRGLAELRSDNVQPTGRVRRPGGGSKSKIETEPGLLAALEELVQSAIRGDPEAPLRWVSRSQRHLVRALARARLHGQSEIGRPVAARAWLQPVRPTGRRARVPRHPDRDRAVRAHQHQDQAVPERRDSRPSRSTRRRRSWSATSGTAAASCGPRAIPSRCGCTTSRYPNWARSRPMASTTSPPTRAGSASASITIPRPSRSRASGAGGAALGEARYPGADRLLITADCGGSNGARVRLWKRELQTLRQRNRPGHHRRPPPARHQQMEPDRASALRLHHAELARQAAGQPPGHRPADRQRRRRRPASTCMLPRRKRLSQRASRSPTPKWPPSTIARDAFHGEWNYTISPPIMGRSGGNGPTLEPRAQNDR